MATALVEAEALERELRAFLAHHEDSHAGGALYDMLSPDAPLFLNGPLLAHLLQAPVDGPAQPEVRTPATLSREAFARYYAASSAEAARRSPHWQLPAVTAMAFVSLQPEGDRTVTWCRLTLADRRTCFLAAGFVLAPTPRLMWATLTPEQQPWRFGDGLAQTLADYPYAVGARFAMPRSWLDVAYYRHFGHDRPQLFLPPGAHFGCHSSARCCRIGFRIELPPAAQSAIDALLGPGHTRLQPQPDGKLLLKEAGEDCRFLDEQRRCRIHQAAGRAVFDVCSRFPFSFEHTPQGVVVGTSPTCPSARRNLGEPLAERADDLYARLAMQPSRTETTFRLAPEHPVSWETFCEAEAELLALLDRDELPMAQRFWLGALALQRRLDNSLPLSESLMPASTAEEREVIEAVLGFFDQPIGLPGPPSAWGTSVLPLVDEPSIRQLLKALLFSKLYSFRYDLLTAFNVTVLVYGIALRAQGHVPGSALPEDFLWRLAAQTMHGLKLLRLGDESDFGQLAQALLRSPNFGLIAIPLLAA